MPLRRGFTPRVQVGTRRKTDWTDGVGDSGVDVFTGTSSAILGAGVSPLTPSLTLVRTRGEVLLLLTAAANPGSGFTGAVGIGKANLAAFTTGGITSLPTPIEEMNWNGWLWHQIFSLIASDTLSGSASVDTDFPNAVSAVARIPIDSKAMRKISDEEVFFCAIEIFLQGGSGTLRVAVNSRMLFKLA